MGAVVFVSEDPGTMAQLSEGLEQGGLRVRWAKVKEARPDHHPTTPDVVVLDGDAAGLNLDETIRAWKALDPAPALVVWSGGAAAQAAAAQHLLPHLGANHDARTVAQALVRALSLRFVGALSRGAAVHAVGARPSGDPLKDVLVILSGARNVPLDKIKDALRAHAGAYVSAARHVELVREHRVLTIPETSVLMALDGTRTVRAVAERGGLDPGGALRLLWALVSAGIVTISPEPIDDGAHPASRLVARARRRLVERRAVVARAQTHFDILEVSPDFERAPAEVEAAMRNLAVWYAPERLAAHDLGELAALVEPFWKAILKARDTLADPAVCKRYFLWLIERGIDLRPRMGARARRDRAEELFLHGQQALASGDAFRAVSELASAARLDPDNPDYEAFVMWARYAAEVARGVDAKAQLARDMATIDQSLCGRRPRPRTLYALGMMAQVFRDLDLAQLWFSEALLAEPSLAAAQRALTKLRQLK